MPLSDKTKTDILNAMTGRTSNVSIAPRCYLGLMTSEPYVNSNPDSVNYGKLMYAEPEDELYSRCIIGEEQAANSNAMGTPVDGVITNEKTIFVAESSVSWGQITHFALFNTKTGGEAFLWGPLTTPVTVEAERVAIFRPGKLTISIT